MRPPRGDGQDGWEALIALLSLVRGLGEVSSTFRGHHFDYRLRFPGFLLR